MGEIGMLQGKVVSKPQVRVRNKALTSLPFYGKLALDLWSLVTFHFIHSLADDNCLLGALSEYYTSGHWWLHTHKVHQYQQKLMKCFYITALDRRLVLYCNLSAFHYIKCTIWLKFHLTVPTKNKCLSHLILWAAFCLVPHSSLSHSFCLFKICVALHCCVVGWENRLNLSMFSESFQVKAMIVF